ncbi:23388_t:CDS:2, partial [Dentiscutata erythropus]
MRYTIFIAWTGSMTYENLRNLFNSDEVQDIRFLPNKQFAHIDFMTEAAMMYALRLHGETRSQIGKLRVEEGRPRGK